MAKRIFDVVFSLMGIIIFLPFFPIIALLIRLDSKGGIIYKSKRVGKNRKQFYIFKFRTMYPYSYQLSITVGSRDNRITRVGYYLRKYKLDEIPQLINVLRGDMSIVGPRPDLPEFEQYYLQYMNNYYSLKPGITAYSSIYFFNESELYVNSKDPDREYIEKTIPKKVKLDREYYNHHGVSTDVAIVLKTVVKILKSGNNE